jgi:hypothetical protein
MVATMRVMAFAGPGAGLQGRIRTDRGWVAASIADTFTVSGLAINVREETGSIWIEVVSRGDVSWPGAIKKQMEDAVEPFLTAFCLRTGIALEVEWVGANYQAPGETRRHVEAWEPVRVVKARDPKRPLSTYAKDAALIEAHGELRAAIEAYRGSTLLAADQPGASLGLAYLSVEGLVTHVLGAEGGSRTSASDWKKAAPVLGADPDALLRLLWSTQLGRHVDPVRAKRQLVARGWEALSSYECCELALDVVVVYAQTL